MIKLQIAALASPFTSTKRLPRANDLSTGGISRPDGQADWVYDFFIEDDCGGVRYLVVEAARRRPGREAVPPPPIPVKLDWRERSFEVILTRAPIKINSDADSGLSISRHSGTAPGPAGTGSRRGTRLKSVENRRFRHSSNGSNYENSEAKQS